MRHPLARRAAGLRRLAPPAGRPSGGPPPGRAAARRRGHGAALPGIRIGDPGARHLPLRGPPLLRLRRERAVGHRGGAGPAERRGQARNAVRGQHPRRPGPRHLRPGGGGLRGSGGRRRLRADLPPRSRPGRSAPGGLLRPGRLRSRPARVSPGPALPEPVPPAPPGLPGARHPRPRAAAPPPLGLGPQRGKLGERGPLRLRRGGGRLSRGGPGRRARLPRPARDLPHHLEGGAAQLRRHLPLRRLPGGEAWPRPDPRPGLRARQRNRRRGRGPGGDRFRRPLRRRLVRVGRRQLRLGRPATRLRSPRGPPGADLRLRRPAAGAAAL